MTKELTNQQILDDLILQRKHLNDVMVKLSELCLDFIELQDTLDFLVKEIDKELGIAKQGRKLLLMVVMHKIKTLTKDVANDISDLWWKGLAKQSKAFRKELDGYKEELEGFRIYTLSTLKEIKEPSVKEYEISEVEDEQPKQSITNTSKE